MILEMIRVLLFFRSLNKIVFSFHLIYLGEKLELLFNESHNSPIDLDALSFPGE